MVVVAIISFVHSPLALLWLSVYITAPLPASIVFSSLLQLQSFPSTDLPIETVTETMRSLLSVVATADNFPAHEGLYPLYHPITKEVYTPFHLTLEDYEADLLPVGLLRPLVLLEIQQEVNDWIGGAFGFVEEKQVHHDGSMRDVIKAVHFSGWVIKEKKMTEVMGKIAEKMRSEGKYLPALRGMLPLSPRRLSSKGGILMEVGWRNELYMIYAPAKSSALEPGSGKKPFGNAAFALERAACGAFGLPTYGVHMTGTSPSRFLPLCISFTGYNGKVWADQ